MKSIKLFFLLIVGIAFFSACNDANDLVPLNKDNENQATFNATIIESLQTRASGTSWDADDAIGIYALNSGANLSEAGIYDGKSNIQYKTSASGAAGDFEAVTPTEAISFPGNGDNLDFIAYYPHTTSVSPDFKCTINLQEQANLAAIDYLYATKNGVNKSTPEVALVFKHKLSRLIIALETSVTGLDLDGATIQLKNIIVDGKLNLTDGTVEKGSSKADASLTYKDDHSATAILMPGQQMSEVTFKIRLHDGPIYEFTPENKVLETNKSIKYTLSLTNGSIVAKEQGTIEDWETETDVNKDVEPNAEKAAVSVDKAAISFTADAGTESVQVTTDVPTQTWTVSGNPAWLTVSAANGTGTGALTFSAKKNTDTAQRTATVTITPATGDAVTIEITQAGTIGAETTNLLFPGSDFEDWTAFEKSLNSKGLKSYAKKTTDSRTGSNALSILGTPSGNDYLFAATVPEGFTPPTKSISFYVKGTSPSKSFSINVYDNGGGYYRFNVEDISTSDVVITPSGSNQYTGIIDTQNQWVKVTLDLSTINNMQATKGENLFAVKVGKKSEWNVVIDDITFE